MAIVGYVGYQGDGKTYWLVRDALRAMEIGLPVVSNFEIVGPHGAATVVDLVEGLGPLYDFSEAHREGSFAAVQEIGQLMPSRMWQKTTTFRAINELSQTRKRRMHLYWDAQHISMVDKLVRSNTPVVWEVRVFKRHPWRRDKEGLLDLYSGRKPPTPWIMRASSYRVRSLEGELTEDGKAKHRLKRRWAWFDLSVAQAFDTYAIAQVRRAAGGELLPGAEPRGPGVGPAVVAVGRVLPVAGARSVPATTGTNGGAALGSASVSWPESPVPVGVNDALTDLEEPLPPPEDLRDSTSDPALL
jgi:hypothetical protein